MLHHGLTNPHSKQAVYCVSAVHLKIYWEHTLQKESRARSDYLRDTTVSKVRARAITPGVAQSLAVHIERLFTYSGPPSPDSPN